MDLINFLETSGKSGLTWNQLGEKFGISGNCAQKRWNRHISKEVSSTEPLSIDEHNLTVDKVYLSVNAKGEETYKYSLSNNKELEKENFFKYLKKLKPKKVKKFKEVSLDTNNELLSVLSLTDFHLDKLNIDAESLEKKGELFISTVKYLVSNASKIGNLDEIVFVIGSDFFHTDNYQNGTTKGTPQDVNSTWHNSYIFGFELLTNAINFLAKSYKKVNILLIQGNHDRQKSFYLAHSLEQFYREHNNIVFYNSPESYKTFTYGDNLLIFHHGDCVIKNLISLISTEEYKLWGQCKNKDVFVGHRHYNKHDEIYSVRVRQLPSLSKEDRWHNDNLFKGSRKSAVIIIYDKNNKYGEFEYTI